jgi:hypothetical protein
LKIADCVLLANKNDKRLTANFPTMAADRAALRCDMRSLRFLGSRDFINITDCGDARPRLAKAATTTSNHQRFRPLRATLDGAHRQCCDVQARVRRNSN